MKFVKNSLDRIFAFGRDKVVTVLTLVVISAILYLISSTIPKETIVGFLNRFGPLGIITFVVLNWITFLAPLTNTPLLLAGFYLYEEKTVIYISVAMVISVITNFWIARFWGKKLVKKFVGEGGMEKINHLTKNHNTVWLFLLLRLFQGGMHKFVSYAFGLTKMSFGEYFTISIIGLIPYLILWYYLSIKISDPIVFIGLTQILSVIFVTIISLVILLRKKSHL